MNSSTIAQRCNAQREALLLGKNVGGLIFSNTATGECTTDEDEVLKWIQIGEGATVCGYFTFEWDGNALKEVWH